MIQYIVIIYVQVSAHCDILYFFVETGVFMQLPLSFADTMDEIGNCIKTPVSVTAFLCRHDG